MENQYLPLASGIALIAGTLDLPMAADVDDVDPHVEIAVALSTVRNVARKDSIERRRGGER